MTQIGGASMLIPGMQVAGGITTLAGIGLSAYGQYQANETAKDNHKMNLLQYNDWKKNNDLIMAYNKKQNELSNTLEYGNYAQGLKKDSKATYGSYNASIGR